MEALTISDIAPDGRGIAMWQGRPVLIANTIPGEVVTLENITETDAVVSAEVKAFIEISADRQKPRDVGCFDGYSWQHIGYEAQLALKTDILATLLEEQAKLKDSPVVLTQPSPEQWNYARRLSLYPINKTGTLGVMQRGIAAPITECATVHPAIIELIAELDLGIEHLSRLDIHANDNGERMLVMQTSDEEAPELEITLPASVNFLLNHFEPFNMIGDTHITHEIFGRPMRMTAGVQSRANVPQLSYLSELVRDMAQAQPDDTILDVYGGIGMFSAALAPHASYITYIDSYPPAATDAEFNLDEFDNVDIVEGRADNVLTELAATKEREAYATVILDPPEHGLNEKVLTAIHKLKVPRIIYVSSNPQLLAKDANRFVYQYGYDLRHVQPIDFAPQTPSFETVALFERP